MTQFPADGNLHFQSVFKAQLPTTFAFQPQYICNEVGLTNEEGEAETEGRLHPDQAVCVGRLRRAVDEPAPDPGC